MANNCKFIQFFKVNLHKASLFLAFLTFQQSFMCFTIIENSSLVYFVHMLLSWIQTTGAGTVS